MERLEVFEHEYNAILDTVHKAQDLYDSKTRKSVRDRLDLLIFLRETWIILSGLDYKDEEEIEELRKESEEIEAEERIEQMKNDTYIWDKQKQKEKEEEEGKWSKGIYRKSPGA